MSEFSCPHCTSGPFKSMAGLTGHIRFKHSEPVAENQEPYVDPATVEFDQRKAIADSTFGTVTWGDGAISTTPDVTWDQDGYNGVARVAAEAQLRSATDSTFVTPPVRIVAEDETLDLRVADMRAQLALWGVNLPDERLRPIARQALVKRWSQGQIVEALDLELMRNPGEESQATDFVTPPVRIEPPSDLTDAQRKRIRQLQREGYGYALAYTMVTNAHPTPEDVAAHTPRPTDRLDQLREHLRNGGIEYQDSLYLYRLAVIGRDAVEILRLSDSPENNPMPGASNIIDRWEAAIS